MSEPIEVDLCVVSQRSVWADTLAHVLSTVLPNTKIDLQVYQVRVLDSDAIKQAMRKRQEDAAVILQDMLLLDLSQGMVDPIQRSLQTIHRLRNGPSADGAGWIGPCLILLSNKGTCVQLENEPLFGGSYTGEPTMASLGVHHRCLLEPILLSSLIEAVMNCLPMGAHAWEKLMEEGPLSEVRRYLQAAEGAADSNSILPQRLEELQRAVRQVKWQKLIVHGSPRRLARQMLAGDSPPRPTDAEWWISSTWELLTDLGIERKTVA